MGKPPYGQDSEDLVELAVKRKAKDASINSDEEIEEIDIVRTAHNHLFDKLGIDCIIAFRIRVKKTKKAIEDGFFPLQIKTSSTKETVSFATTEGSMSRATPGMVAKIREHQRKHPKITKMLFVGRIQNNGEHELERVLDGIWKELKLLIEKSLVRQSP